VPRPGTDIRIVDDAPRGGAILDTGQAFFAGVTERGSIVRPQQVTSLSDYRTKYGGRAGGSLMYDAVSAFFSEGGGTLYVSRVAAADADAAAGDLGTALHAEAASPGTWGNALNVSAVAPPTGSGFVIVVKQNDVTVDQSTAFTTNDQAVAWSQGRSWVTLTKLGATVPAAGAEVDLTGGTAGATPTQADIGTALARFEYGMGPGQVALPGFTSSVAHAELLEHADANRRVVLLDLTDTPDDTTLAAQIEALSDDTRSRYAMALAPWISYPAEAAGAQVTVPFSGIQAALIARADAASGNPNQPAAGANGVHRLSLGLSQEYADDVREALNNLGVSLAKVKYNSVRTYGYRTAAGPADTNWLWFGNSRVVMAIAHECDAVAENYVLRQIDGRRQIFAALETDLRGVLLRYFNLGALYGENPQDAFAVDTGPAVNTIDTIKAGEIHAVVRVKCSPAAEWVQIDIVKVPIEQALAA
jgi:phage tail sheath protein FI